MNSFYFFKSIILLLSFESISCWLGREDVDYNEVVASIVNNETIFDKDVLQPKVGIMFPGTNWCGPGNKAKFYDDLGRKFKADACCRQHDFCPDYVESFGHKYHLKNHALYTRLNCHCDLRFLKCLKAANTKTANKIGVIYFNGILTKCFRRDYPVIGCKKRGGWLNMKCIEYKYNYHGQKKYQWFDEPEYVYSQYFRVFAYPSY